MSDENIVLKPLTITPNPLPDPFGQTAIPDQLHEQIGPLSRSVFSPNATPDFQTPQNAVAQDTISQSLNTKTKQILSDYTFGESGAIGIGKYAFGVSGEIKLSPDGIIAKNVNGDTTFGLNAATGEATFQGEVRAKDFVIADEKGIVSLANFTATNFLIGGVNQSITSLSPQVLTGSTFTIVNTRSKIYQLSISIISYITESTGNTGDTRVDLYINGYCYYYVYILGSGYNHLIQQSQTINIPLPAGSFTFDLRGFFTGKTGNPSFTIYALTVDYISFGS